MQIGNIESLDATIEPILRAARIPGAAIAIVAGNRTICARGYGLRNRSAKLPMMADTVYPIASTTKAINATLLGILVDEGLLGWDVPVQTYLPSFRLMDPLRSAQVTLRDLITMRTGLPRHDWLWLGSSLGRAEIIDRLRHLELSSGFRERFQYNNLTATAAGHVAEVVTGRSWEELVRDKLLEPLGMHSTHACRPSTGNVTLSYFEADDRELRLTEPMAAEVTAPSGGALHSTVEDMARWVAFNLSQGQAQQRQLIRPLTLQEICSPQIVVGNDPSAPMPGAAYAMGWFVDRYRGSTRISHGGYLHDVNSEVTLLPEHQLGVVSTTNFGCPRLARFINQTACDVLRGMEPVQTLDAKLAEYEDTIAGVRHSNAAAPRVNGTAPSHALEDYAGVYVHAGYGYVEIRRDGQTLVLRRSGLVVPLEHWHYDTWAAGGVDQFPANDPHPFDRAHRILFETNVDGQVAALSIRFEPAVAAVCSKKLLPS